MRALPLLLLLALGACGTATPPDMLGNQATMPLANIAKFTVTDLQAADADAVLNNDMIAHTCYPALIQFVNTNSVATAATPAVGAFSAFQIARNALRSTDSTKIPDYLVIGCSPLALSAGMDLISFLNKLAGLAAAPNPLAAIGGLFPILGDAIKVAPVLVPKLP